ncbi:MAG: MFS transporter [Fermentimonas sp.]|nr:MFS transporter [Fermentimonas sp.]
MLNKIIHPFRTLRNRTFSKLFASQIASLLGDSFIWLGLALISYELNPTQSSSILAFALTMRVLAYILLSPFSGVVSDRFKRKNILLVTQLTRMLVVGLLLFVSAEWQLYVLVFLLNAAAAFYTPTYRAIIPLIVDRREYREANGLSMAVFQLLSVFGPAIAGIFSMWIGVKQLFMVSTAMLFLSFITIFSIPSDLIQNIITIGESDFKSRINSVTKGIHLLFGNKILRFSLSMEFVAAIAGALVLVNSVALVKNTMQLDDSHYGLIMAFFGLGGAITAFLLGSLDKSKSRSLSLISGALLISVSVSFANFVSFNGLVVLWILAGIGQTLADLPSETLIGENINVKDQANVYGSHFAFSHLWWFIAYPVAGFLGNTFPDRSFLYGGIMSLFLTVAAILIFKKPFRRRRES